MLGTPSGSLRMSTTSHLEVSVKPPKPMPSVVRMKLRPPSLATRYLQRSALTLPLCCTVRLTPVASWSNFSSSAPIHTSTLAKRLRPSISSRSTAGWLKALRRDQPKSSVRGSMDAKQRPLAVTKRIQW
jgi:hypothetical protein